MDTKTLTQTATKVNAIYKTLGTFFNVLVKMPMYGTDEHMKFIQGHTLEINNQIVTIQDHYRRSDIFGGIFLPKNFFVGIGHTGEMILADKVEIVKKTNHEGAVNFIINIDKSDEETSAVAAYRLKVGSNTGDYLIPGTSDKFIKLEKI